MPHRRRREYNPLQWINAIVVSIMLATVMPVAAQSDAPERKTADFYDGDGAEIPMWRIFYRDNLAGNLVRPRMMPLDSLPDEINLKLLKDSATFCFPMKNIITSPYGWRERWQRPHRGVDILLRTGDPVYACFDGVVRIARPMGGYGNLVVLRHENGLETVYGHLSKIKVRPRQRVKAGDIIGLGGSTGRSTGPHLHFEVRFQYEPFDPEWILDFSNYTLRTRRLHLDKTYFGISRPKDRKTPIFKADKSIFKERPFREKPREVYYEIKNGDTLERIAMLHSTTVEQLKELNPKLKKAKAGLKIRVR
ncbi:MAG: peptidoglycan DD-metalloendopeptidase family protein [Bacteroidales bacterium]|nr:peptidoglycan DD-metalloendopeptidase family protein [Bacteroidales bacterium]